MSRSNETFAPLSIIVAQNNKERTELPLVVGPDHLEDPGQSIIGKRGRKQGHGLHEVEAARSIGRPTSRDDGHLGSGVKTLNVNGGVGVGGLVDAGKLLHDCNPDASLKRDRVTHTNSLESGWQLSGAVALEEAGIHIPDLLRCVDGAHSNDQDSLTSRTTTNWVGDKHDVIVEVGAVDVEHQLDEIVDLFLGSLLPVLVAEIAWQTLATHNGHAILFGPIQDPIVELGTGREPVLGGADLMIVLALEVGQAIVVTTNRLLHDYKLLIGDLHRDLKSTDGLIEEVEDVVQARNWSQENATGHQVLAAEAG